MSLKRTPADDAFSRCIRERADWTCELCGTVYPEAQATGRSRGLHCSHFIGRGNWSVRFNSSNAFCHCYACHVRFGSDKYIQEKHYLDIFGGGKLVFLEFGKNSTFLGRDAKKSQREISAHYRQEYERMRKLRAKGQRGRIEFMSWS